MPTGVTYQETATMVTIDCVSCGMMFAVPEVWERKRRRSHDWFYCPNGHNLHFPQESDVEKQQRLREQAERVLARREQDLEHERRSHAATKGQLTKTRKRVAGGVCPCCNRSFVNLARHMQGQHPDFEVP
jgi:hypothetical protein